jgi:hypothetical protein
MPALRDLCNGIGALPCQALQNLHQGRARGKSGAQDAFAASTMACFSSVNSLFESSS